MLAHFDDEGRRGRRCGCCPCLAALMAVVHSALEPRDGGVAATASDARAVSASGAGSAADVGAASSRAADIVFARFAT